MTGNPLVDYPLNHRLKMLDFEDVQELQHATAKFQNASNSQQPQGRLKVVCLGAAVKGVMTSCDE